MWNSIHEGMDDLIVDEFGPPVRVADIGKYKPVNKAATAIAQANAEAMEPNDRRTPREPWTPATKDKVVLVKQYIKSIPAKYNVDRAVDHICALGLDTAEKRPVVVVNVKWEGCPYSENTWEPLSSMKEADIPEEQTRSGMREEALRAAPVSQPQPEPEPEPEPES